MNLPYELEHFAAAVRSGRNALGWSQKELAMRLGVAALTIVKLENGANPKASTMLQILRLFYNNGVKFTWREDGFNMETFAWAI